ncbi:hypothetical protein N8I77_003165 [Diaporthe amygdali]|uniref:Mtf2-like C-terminal domain-containing protein n=1 Tax=Phomopsis amygdali TaxID=1214568 RepID=A0AAD9SHF6_PHOAM|nr:hypothetical protein N8I77_003165 [Diaporthe amygdali]
MSATLTPFLFQTRTLARFARAGSVAPPRLARSLRIGTGRRRGTSDHDPIPFELPPELENPDTLRRAEPLDTGTITPVERQAFDKIFKEINEKGKSLPIVPPKREDTPDLAQTEPSFLKALYDGGPFNISAIIQDAAERQTETKASTSGFDPLSPLESTFSAADRERALLKFPPSLRRGARTAFGMLDSARDVSVTTEGGAKEELGLGNSQVDAVEAVESSDRLSKTLEVEALRREARLAIKVMMEQAENDFALWDVVEKEVFPLVKKLGISNTQSLPEPSPKAKKAKRVKKKKAVANEEESPASAEAAAQAPAKAELSMDIYGPIYPMLLLDALHLLDKKFSRPSPLVFSLLPRIKQLGLASYVLGVSTPFYNKLISVLWERFGDAGGALSLLEEMRHAGLSFDEETKSVVHQIERVLFSAERGDNGQFLKKLMDMPEYEPILAMRLSHWVGQIDRSINERNSAFRY